MDEEKAKILSVAGLREARNRLGICHAARQRWLISHDFTVSVCWPSCRYVVDIGEPFYAA